MNKLRPTVEENGFTLCLQDTDFFSWGSKIKKNVLKAIDNCLHTIFLSGDQLDNDWQSLLLDPSVKSQYEKNVIT